ncbi:MAG: (Fe-S)-binding protein, partial [Myxococcota bacterium]
MVNAIVMSLMLVVALGVFAFLMVPRLRLLAAAQPTNRFDQVPERVKSVLKFAIGQWRMPRVLIAGVALIFIFLGFLVVSLSSVQHIVHAYAPGWHLLPSPLNELYTLVKDLIEVLVLLGVSYALYRRLSPAPSRVGRSWEGVFILMMITTLMLTDFLSYGAWMQAAAGDAPAPFVWWNPIGWLAGQLVAGTSSATAQTVGDAAWWIHCATVLTFLNFLPIGKHFHVITGIPDVYFRNLEPYGAVPKMDLEDENAESY